MALTTKIVVQQVVALDQDSIQVGKYPKYTVRLGTSIGSITASELNNAIIISAENAEQARLSAESALASKDAAKISEDNSKLSETNAGLSEVAAKASEEAAKISETNAKASEVSANESETNASASAQSALESKTQVDAALESILDDVDIAVASAQQAKASELAAKTSETNAKASELAAKASETNAADSVASIGDAVEQSANNAATALAAQQAASASASIASTAETNAKASELAAATAEANARASELLAVSSATQATDSAESARVSAEASQASAVVSTSKSEVSTSEADRAKAEADRAAEATSGMLNKEGIAGFFKSYKNLADAQADVANRVLDEQILVWNQTSSSYGWYTVTGTASAPTLTFENSEQRLISVNNVQPDTSGNVQITLPGGNPSLWLGEITLFPYEEGNTIGYSGVLPADGRELLRADYQDTWDAIEAGLIPSVSETEWQAGNNLVFSTGNGTTTFRLPNLMQGQALRAPTPEEANPGSLTSQVPYITSINSIEPEEDGSVTLDIPSQSDIDAKLDKSGGILTGPLTLAGDATQDLEPVTKQQLDALPVGGLPLLHSYQTDTREHIEAGEAPQDGQLLSRALFPDAWAAIQAKRTVITDAAWLADPLKRGQFSSGDGSTTFRIPDKNGKYSGSLGATVGRGDGAKSAGTPGILQMDAARNITGSFEFSPSSGVVLDISTLSGAFVKGTTNKTAGPNTQAIGAKDLMFDASKAPGFLVAEENRVLSVTTCWVIKLAGSAFNEGQINALELATEIAALTTQVDTLRSDAFTASQVANTPWINLTLQNGWTVAAPFVARYRKVLGMVFIEASVKGGTFVDGTVIFTMPLGSRPSGFLVSPAVGVTIAQIHNPRVSITPEGLVQIAGMGGGSTVSLLLNYSLQ